MKPLRLIGATLLAMLCLAAAFAAGLLLAPAEEPSGIVYALLVALVALAFVLIVGSAVLNARLMRRLRGQSVMQTQQQVLARHAEAQEDISRIIKPFFRSLKAAALYIAGLCLLALSIAFLAGYCKETATVLILLSAYILYGIFVRLLRGREKPVMNGELRREEYPLIFRALDKAVEKLSIAPPFKVVSDGQFNASVFSVTKKKYALNLGVQLLYLLNEPELEQLFLHELAHMANDDVRRTRAAGEFLEFITSGEGDPLSGFASILFDYPAHLMVYRYMLTEAATSSAKEARADAVIREHGDPAAYAALLAKMAYFELFGLESDRYPETLAFVSEEPRENNRCLMDAFVNAAKERGPFWDTVIQRELPALVDSHPTFRQRWESMGSCRYSVVFPDRQSPNDFDCETARATHAADLFWIEQVKPNYEKLREHHYLKPLSTVEEWERTRELLSADRMTPILNAYMALNRYGDAVALCDRMIEADPQSPSNAYAKFIKGNELLCSYDPAGIDYVMEAVEANSNFAENGLNAIILFCRRMGMQEELELYRARILEKMQNYADTHEHANSLKLGDRLSVEELPENRGEEILAFIRSVSEDAVRQVYLVRKTVTEEFFTSAFVIRFKEGTDGEVLDRVMDQIFEHLDKAPYDWKYSLFLYENEPKVYEQIFRRLPACKLFDADET